MPKNTLIIIFLLLINILSAQIAPQNILLQKCLFSYTTQYKYLKSPKAFAYARVQLGEKDSCAWSQKAMNLKNAKTIALTACREKRIDAQCKIVDMNNTWIVQENDFTTIVPADNTPLSPHKYTQLTNQAKKLVLGECLSLFNTHLKDKGHKVFAYSVDEDGRFACGTSQEYQTLREAALIAIQRCEMKRTTMANKAPKHTCLSLSDGKKILLSDKDFNLKLQKKTNTFLDLKSYHAYVQKAKKHLSGPCLTQYKYYLRVKEHKAFYIAKGKKGEITCSHSFNQFTISSAKKQALKKCETAVKFKKTHPACKLFDLNLLSKKALEKKHILE